MFDDLAPETGYRITLHLIRGVTTKLVENYLLDTGVDYYRLLKSKETYRLVLDLKRTAAQLHRYLSSLGSNKNQPKTATLRKYLLKCRAAKMPLLYLNCHHLTSSWWYILSAYEQLLEKMLGGVMPRPVIGYPAMFTTISKDLIAAVIHHETFISDSSFADRLTNAKKTFDVLLREKNSTKTI